jgi:hypothetical protein
MTHHHSTYQAAGAGGGAGLGVGAGACANADEALSIAMTSMESGDERIGVLRVHEIHPPQESCDATLSGMRR